MVKVNLPETDSSSKKNKKRAHIISGCVACGACAPKCPSGSISIYKGLYAVINPEMCKGCGICAKSCAANVIRVDTATGG
ncbi:MAG: 4Fe-4S binding protein [Deferribacteraceae bacterium]|nr:4Fe-4S binding protein [Deferribacteraceae bacterium]